MNLHDPIHVVMLGVFIAGFVAGVAFAGAVVWLETARWRKRNRSFIGIDFAGAGDDYTIYEHYEDGVMHVDRVEMGGEPQ